MSSNDSLGELDGLDAVETVWGIRWRRDTDPLCHSEVDDRVVGC